MRSKYIQMLADASKTEYHELILDCISYFGTDGTKDLSELQLKHFCRIKGLIG